MRVDVVPLRDAVLASDRPLSRIAHDLWGERAGNGRHTGVGDAARLKRLIGLLPMYTTRRGGQRYVRVAETIAYDKALAIALAIGRDPYEVGL